MHKSNVPKSEWWGSNEPATIDAINTYLEQIDAQRTNPPFGLELPMYSELADLNIRIFAFASEASERIIYSCDLGKTVMERRVNRGVLKGFIEALPNMV